MVNVNRYGGVCNVDNPDKRVYQAWRKAPAFRHGECQEWSGTTPDECLDKAEKEISDWLEEDVPCGF